MKEQNFSSYFFFNRPKKLLNFLKVQEKIRWDYCGKHLKSKHSFEVLRKFHQLHGLFVNTKWRVLFLILFQIKLYLNEWSRIHPQTVRPHAILLRNIWTLCPFNLFAPFLKKSFSIKIVKPVLYHFCTVFLSFLEPGSSDLCRLLCPSQQTDLKSPVTAYMSSVRLGLCWVVHLLFCFPSNTSFQSGLAKNTIKISTCICVWR